MGRKTSVSPLALTLLAAMTPPHYDVHIVDEQIEPIPADAKPDLVGITALTNTSGRAYDLADRFRAQGVPVVVGGPHVTFSVDEALEHADAVVAGEAEGVWPRCLEDFEAGRLGGVYRPEGPVEFRTSPPPRWDLVDTRQVLAMPVQASRGCPYRCEFCIVTQMFGHKMRYRDVDDVIAEIESLPVKEVLFVDDNLTMNRRFAAELMERLATMEVSWSCQASIDVGKDTQLLQQMADAGCEQIIIGFESLNPASLRSMRKAHNRVEEFQAAIDNIHAAGLLVFASFVVGFDEDTLDEFTRIHEFARRAPLPYVMLNPLAATPGTALYDRVAGEGRWLGWHVGERTGVHPRMEFCNFTQAELFTALVQEVQRLYSWEAIYERTVPLLARGTFQRDRRSDELGVGFKAKMFTRVVGSFLFSRDPHKRRMGIEVLDMGRKGVVSMARAVSVLVGMEAYHQHLEQLCVYEQEFVRAESSDSAGS